MVISPLEVLNILLHTYKLSHDTDCNMANILRVSDILQTFFTKEAVAKTCAVKKVFLKVSQNSQEKTCFYRTPLMATSVYKPLG